MKRYGVYLGIIVLFISSLVIAKPMKDEMHRLEQGLRTHRMTRDKLEHKRSALANQLLKKEADLTARLAQLDQTRKELSVLDAEIIEINNVLADFADQEARVMDSLKESQFGMQDYINKRSERNSRRYRLRARAKIQEENAEQDVSVVHRSKKRMRRA